MFPCNCSKYNLLFHVFALTSSGKKGFPTVGKYEVQIKSFEKVAVQALMIAPESSTSSRHRPEGSTSSTHRLVVIDEIGKMELFSQEFVQLVRTTFEQKHCIVLATIPVAKGRPIALLEDLRQRQDCQLFEVLYMFMYGTCEVFSVWEDGKRVLDELRGGL